MFEKSKISIKCPQCGDQSKKTVAWLKSHKQFSCTCGAVNDIDAGQLLGGIKQANKSMDDFKRSLKRFGR